MSKLRGVYHHRVVDTLDGISLGERSALSRAILSGSLKELPRLGERIISPWTPVKNKLVNEGEDSILSTYFQSQNAPASFLLGLAKSSLGADETAVAESATYAGTIAANEVGAGIGYAQGALTRDLTGFPTLAAQKVTSATKQIGPATGDWGVVRFQFLLVATSNKLVSVAKFPADHNILTGYRFDVYWELTLD